MDFYYGSDVQPVPDCPVPYVCAVQKELPKEDQTVWWLLVMTQRDANNHVQKMAALRSDAPGGAQRMAAFADGQFMLMRDRCVKIENYPERDGGRRSAITEAGERMAVFETLSPEIFGEISQAIQSWSTARAGILGNSDSQCSGRLQKTRSETQSEPASTASKENQ